MCVCVCVHVCVHACMCNFLKNDSTVFSHSLRIHATWMDKNHYLLQILWSFEEILSRQLSLITGSDMPRSTKFTTSLWIGLLTSFVGTQSSPGISHEPVSHAKAFGISKVWLKSIHFLEGNKREVIWLNPAHLILSVMADITKHYRLDSL